MELSKRAANIGIIADISNNFRLIPNLFRFVFSKEVHVELFSIGLDAVYNEVKPAFDFFNLHGSGLNYNIYRIAFHWIKVKEKVPTQFCCFADIGGREAFVSITQNIIGAESSIDIKVIPFYTILSLAHRRIKCLADRKFLTTESHSVGNLIFVLIAGNESERESKQKCRKNEKFFHLIILLLCPKGSNKNQIIKHLDRFPYARSAG